MGKGERPEGVGPSWARKREKEKREMGWMEREVRKEMGQNCSTRPAANFLDFSQLKN